MTDIKTVQCANCSWSGPEDQSIELEDISERVGPGETMPAGECPDCGAVVHYVASAPELQEVIANLESIVAECPAEEPDAEDYDDMDSASTQGIAVGRYETAQSIKPVIEKLKLLIRA